MIEEFEESSVRPNLQGETSPFPSDAVTFSIGSGLNGNLAVKLRRTKVEVIAPLGQAL
jgi:hypothetical protein